MIQTFSRLECKKALLSANSTIKQAAESLSSSLLKICLVVNDQNQLLGVVGDGDIRRALLNNYTLDHGINDICNKTPLVVPEGMSSTDIYNIMITNKIFAIPEVDSSNKLTKLYSIGKVSSIADDITMFIFAGGRGKRLKPFTDTVPKPMLKINGIPMLETIILQARSEGIARFIISVNYLSEIIQEYFNDGSLWGVSISYVHEDVPLGTAGSLSLLQNISHHPLLVTNCDVITEVSYMSVFDFHIRHQADATMAVRSHEIQNPFGVVYLDGLNIIDFEEKPYYKDYINAGIYCLSSQAIASIPHGEYCDMPSLFGTLKDQNKKIVAYPMYEPWRDVGHHADFRAANHN